MDALASSHCGGKVSNKAKAVKSHLKENPALSVLFVSLPHRMELQSFRRIPINIWYISMAHLENPSLKQMKHTIMIMQFEPVETKRLVSWSLFVAHGSCPLH
jgi:hypothetical protein